jgi:hypothetical protein
MYQVPACTIVRKNRWGRVYAGVAEYSLEPEAIMDLDSVRFNIAKAELELDNWKRRRTYRGSRTDRVGDSGDSGNKVSSLRECIVSFYSYHDPSKLDDAQGAAIDRILTQFSGRAPDLALAWKNKYGEKVEEN